MRLSARVFPAFARGLLKNDHEFLSGLVSSTRIDHDARGLTARGALFTTKRVSFFWAVVSQLSRGLLEGVAGVLHGEFYFARA